MTQQRMVLALRRFIGQAVLLLTQNILETQILPCLHSNPIPLPILHYNIYCSTSST